MSVILSIFRSASALDNHVYDPREFGEINSNSNDQPSRDERILMNPLYTDISLGPGGEAPPGNTTHQIRNSFHMYDVVGFENENVHVANTPNAHELPIAHTASNTDTGEYSTLDSNSRYSTLGPTAITHPPGEEGEYSHLHH